MPTKFGTGTGMINGTSFLSPSPSGLSSDPCETA